MPEPSTLLLFAAAAIVLLVIPSAAASISVRRVGPDDVKAWASMRVALLRGLRSSYSGAASSELQASIES